MIVAHLISLGIRRWLKCRRLARLVYAVTDHRAIVARIESPVGSVAGDSRSGPGEVVDTRRFENPDGSGDLFFLGKASDQWLPLGFLEVPRVGLVEIPGPRDAARPRSRTGGSSERPGPTESIAIAD